MEALVALNENVSILYEIDLWLITLLFMLMLFISAEVGYRVGLLRRRHLGEADADQGGGGVVLTAMFALLGLIIAFTYSASASRYEARKQAVNAEANALGTAFLRANLVAEPGSTELKMALYNYALTRVPGKILVGDALYRDDNRLHALEATLAAQAGIWPITETIVLSTTPGPVEVSLVAAVNDVLDVHTLRMAAVFDKLPSAVVWMLVIIAGASLSVTGYNAGVSGRISRWRMTIFASVLAGVMVVIIDFDRPLDGWVQVQRTSVQFAISDMEDDLGIATPE